MPRALVCHPAVASSGESEETTDSGRGSCEDVAGRCGRSQSKAVPSVVQTLNLPLRQQSSDTGNSFVMHSFSSQCQYLWLVDVAIANEAYNHKDVCCQLVWGLFSLCPMLFYYIGYQ